jgi:hypothetical protein
VSELTELGRQVAVRDSRAKSQHSVPSNALLPGAQQISSEAKGGGSVSNTILMSIFNEQLSTQLLMQ